MSEALPSSEELIFTCYTFLPDSYADSLATSGPQKVTEPRDRVTQEARKGAGVTAGALV